MIKSECLLFVQKKLREILKTSEMSHLFLGFHAISGVEICDFDLWTKADAVDIRNDPKACLPLSPKIWKKKYSKVPYLKIVCLYWTQILSS